MHIHRHMILCLAFMLLIQSVHGQSANDYNFINKAIPQLISVPNSELKLIAERTSLPLISKENVHSYYRELNHAVSVDDLKEIITNRTRLSANKPYYFSRDSLKDVTVITGLQVDSIQNVNAKNEFSSIVYGVLTLPLFNKKKTVAVISYGYGTARNRLSGYLYLFKKVNGAWKLEKKFSNWST